MGKIVLLSMYGLTQSKFLKLKKKVTVKIYLTFPKEEKYFEYKAADRITKINEILKQEYAGLIKALPHKNFVTYKSRGGPRNITIELLPSEIKPLLNKKFIKSIWIEHISGIKKKKEKKQKLWFAVKAIFNIQFEGFKGGMNEYEERIVLVNAYNHEDAVKVAEKEFKEYSYSYLNTDMVMVRWNYERILSIYETDIYKSKLDPSGTEVFSEFKYRKLKPKYEWHPIKKYKKI